MRQRVDKLGVSEPEIRKQGTEPDRDPAPGRPRSAARRQDHRRDRAAPALRPRDRRDRPVGRRRAGQRPGDEQPLRPARAASRPDQGRQGEPVRTTSSTRRRSCVAGPKQRHADQLLKKFERQGAEGREGLRRPARPRGRHVRHGSGDLPAAGSRRTRTSYYLFKYDPSNAQLASRFPQMKGDDLKLSGTQADIDTTTGQPEVLMQFTGKGGKKFHEITRDEVDPRPQPRQRRSTSRSSSTTRSSRSRSSTTPTSRSRTASTRSTAPASPASRT